MGYGYMEINSLSLGEWCARWVACTRCCEMEKVTSRWVHRVLTFVLGAQVLHADETPVRMLDPGAGKTIKAYIWAYARGEHDHTPGVIYDFCAGRGAKYPMAFLQGWCGTVTCDD